MSLLKSSGFFFPPSFPSQRLFDEELPLLANGFLSVTELVDTLKDIFDLLPAEDDSGHHWKVVNIQDGDHTQSGVLMRLPVIVRN